MKSISNLIPILSPGNSVRFLSDWLLLDHPSCELLNAVKSPCENLNQITYPKSITSNTGTESLFELKVNICRIENRISFIDRSLLNSKLELRVAFYCDGIILGNIYVLPVVSSTAQGLVNHIYHFSANPILSKNAKSPETKLVARFPVDQLGISLFFELVLIDEAPEGNNELSLYWTALLLVNDKGSVIENTKYDLTLHQTSEYHPSSTHFHPRFFNSGKASNLNAPTLCLSTSSFKNKWKHDSSILPSLILIPTKSLPLLSLIRKCLMDEVSVSPWSVSSDPFLGFIFPWLNTPERFLFLYMLCYHERKKMKKPLNDISISALKAIFLPILAEVPPITSKASTCPVSSPSLSPHNKKKLDPVFYTPFHSDECKTSLYKTPIPHLELHNKFL